MSLLDLLRRVPRQARVAAKQLPFISRMREIIQPPPNHTRYVSAGLRRVEGVAFALRGYHVCWHATAATRGFQAHALVYRTVNVRGFNRQAEPIQGITTFVELPTIVPGEVHRAVSWVSSARAIGWRFTWLQIKRELPWVLQRRRTR